MKINTFDIDGVIWLGEEFTGIRPHKDDVIITGRPIEELDETLKMLRSRDICNFVFMNLLSRSHKDYGRESSGKHKAKIVTYLKDEGFKIGFHFEDDPVQIAEIKKVHPDLKIIHVVRENEDDVKY